MDTCTRPTPWVCISTHTHVCAIHTPQNALTRQKSHCLTQKLQYLKVVVTYQLQQLSQGPAQIFQRNMLQANDGQNFQRAHPEVWIPCLWFRTLSRQLSGDWSGWNVCSVLFCSPISPEVTFTSILEVPWFFEWSLDELLVISTQ